MSEIYNGQEIRSYDSAPAIGSTPVNSVESGGGGGGGGTTWYSGSSAPSSGTGAIGDFFFDTSNVRIYGPKTISGWGTFIALQGAAGAAGVGIPVGGATGQVLKKVNETNYNTQWADDLNTGGGGGGGNVLLNGAGTPSNGLGANGDFYINTSITAIHGPKAGGVWPAAVSMIGTQGIQGIQGIQGVTGLQGNTGGAGPGVPAGGTTGQVLAKIDGTNYNTQWTTSAGGGGLDTAAGDARYLKLDSQPVTLGIPLSNDGPDATIITASTSVPKNRIRVPFGFTLTEVRATLSTADTAAVTTVDIHGLGDTTILGTKLTIDVDEKTSVTAAAAATIPSPAVADDTEISVYCDAVGTVARGLKVWLLGYRTVTNSPTTPTAPAQVGTVTLTPSSNQIALAWSAPSPGSSAITDYVVEQSLNGTTGWAAAAGGSVSATTGQTVTGLTPSTLYYYRVAAVNAVGQGSYSNVVSATTSATATAPAVAAAPTFASVAPTSMTINWVAPASGGSPITQVVLQRATDAGFTTAVTTLLTDTTDPFLLTFNDTGLTASTTYHYRAIYTNAVGTTNGTGASRTTTAAATVPAAPTISNVAVGDTQLVVTLTPGSNGGSAITGYDIQRSLDGTTGWTSVNLANQSANPFTNTGLTNGTAYHYRALAFNAIGDSTFSAVSGPHTPSGVTVPGTPTITAMSVMVEASGTLSFTAPPDGATPTKYQYRWAKVEANIGSSPVNETDPPSDLVSPTNVNGGDGTGYFTNRYMQLRAVAGATPGPWSASFVYQDTY